MARSDLLVKLVKAGGAGDKDFFKKIVESLIAEEKGKQHHILADQLEKELRLLSNNDHKSSGVNLTGIFLGPSENIDSYLLSATPRKTFDDIILDSKIDKSINELVSEHHRKDLLRSYNLEPRNRVLLVGPPGNGKTSLAEALANALMVPFFSIRYDGIIGSYLGETANRLKKTFDFLRTQECLVFFDEFDAIGKERGDLNETGEIKRVVNSLLMQIDTLPSYVTVVAATNHPELLDRAIWRRFQLRLTLKKPTQAKIRIWLKKFEDRIGTTLSFSHDILSKRLLGLSYSDIEEFGLNIQRKFVLSQPTSNLKQIISECIKDDNLKFRIE